MFSAGSTIQQGEEVLPIMIISYLRDTIHLTGLWNAAPGERKGQLHGNGELIREYKALFGSDKFPSEVSRIGE